MYLTIINRIENFITERLYNKITDYLLLFEVYWRYLLNFITLLIEKKKPKPLLSFCESLKSKSDQDR